MNKDNNANPTDELAVNVARLDRIDSKLNLLLDKLGINSKDAESSERTRDESGKIGATDEGEAA